jgi:hypothetical protein
LVLVVQQLAVLALPFLVVLAQNLQTTLDPMCTMILGWLSVIRKRGCIETSRTHLLCQLPHHASSVLAFHLQTGQLIVEAAPSPILLRNLCWSDRYCSSLYFLLQAQAAQVLQGLLAFQEQVELQLMVLLKLRMSSQLSALIDHL